MAALIAGTRLTRKIAAAAPFASVLGRELFPGPSIDNDEDLADDLRRRVELRNTNAPTIAVAERAADTIAGG